MVPYRYISVRALSGFVIVSKITFSYLKYDCECHNEHNHTE